MVEEQQQEEEVERDWWMLIDGRMFVGIDSLGPTEGGKMRQRRRGKHE